MAAHSASLMTNLSGERPNFGRHENEERARAARCRLFARMRRRALDRGRRRARFCIASPRCGRPRSRRGGAAPCLLSHYARRRRRSDCRQIATSPRARAPRFADRRHSRRHVRRFVAIDDRHQATLLLETFRPRLCRVYESTCVAICSMVFFCREFRVARAPTSFVGASACSRQQQAQRSARARARAKSCGADARRN